MIIALELDHIISSPLPNSYDLQQVSKCELLPGAVDALKKLKELNHSILIFSNRDSSLGMDTEIWLRKNSVPYDRILFNKPKYDVMIDNKTHKFKDWEQFFQQYKNLLHTR